VPRSTIKKLGILGAGLMGQGVAQVSAKVGIDVVLLDRDLAAAERGKERVAASLQRDLDKGRTTQAKKDALLARIHATASYEDLAGCDLVVEAVFEDRGIKAAVTKAAEAVLGPDAVFATNTSGLPITGLAEASVRPENFIGMHFFSPVERMQMVEVIMGAKTSQATLAKAWDFILAIKKAAIVVNDSPGFYTSRVFGTFITEGNQLLLEGVAPALIENAAKLAGMPMPPLSISDQVGLGTMHKVAQQAKKDHAAAGKEWNPSPAQGVIAKLIEIVRPLGRVPAAQGRRHAAHAGRLLRVRGQDQAHLARATERAQRVHRAGSCPAQRRGGAHALSLHPVPRSGPLPGAGGHHRRPRRRCGGDPGGRLPGVHGRAVHLHRQLRGGRVRG
jgi:3-hydroxyacyl-CoA dehydrogenase/enoyl-CoA hydratase/3-hydroxybutyryl-CoA epimerase